MTHIEENSAAKAAKVLTAIEHIVTKVIKS